MTYEDDIALLADDIRRYSNNDGRIDEALTQMLKLVAAEIDALAFEAIELDRQLKRVAQPAVTWAHRVPDWRGDDYNAGAPPEDRSQM